MNFRLPEARVAWPPPVILSRSPRVLFHFGGDDCWSSRPTRPVCPKITIQRKGTAGLKPQPNT